MDGSPISLRKKWTRMSGAATGRCMTTASGVWLSTTLAGNSGALPALVALEGIGS